MSNIHTVNCAPVRRTWQSWHKNAEGEVGVMKFEEIVIQHDVVRFGNSLFWRGAKISPNFSL